MSGRRTWGFGNFRWKRLRLLLPNEAWFDLAELAELRSTTVPQQIEALIQAELVLQHPMIHPRPPVYYDSQGREHEAGDVAEGAPR